MTIDPFDRMRELRACAGLCLDGLMGRAAEAAKRGRGGSTRACKVSCTRRVCRVETRVTRFSVFSRFFAEKPNYQKN